MPDAESIEEQCSVCQKELLPDKDTFGNPVGLNVFVKDRYVRMAGDIDEKHRVALVDSVECLKILLEGLLGNPYDYEGQFSFRDVSHGAGGWPGPSGCQHWLSFHRGPEVYEDVMNWIRYFAYGHIYDSLSDMAKDSWKDIARQMLKVEPRSARISFSGWYGGLLDGTYHFCSAECALKCCFPASYPSSELVLADLFSHQGAPVLERRAILFSSRVSIGQECLEISV